MPVFDASSLLSEFLKLTFILLKYLTYFSSFPHQIEYAKANIDGAKAKASSTKTKFLEVWDEINTEEGENIEMSNLGEPNGEASEGEKTPTGEQQLSNAVSIGI